MNTVLPLNVSEIHTATGVASMMWLAVAIPFISCCTLLLLGKKSDKWGHFLAIGASATAFLLGLLSTIQLLQLDSSHRLLETKLFTWVALPGLTIDLGTRVDPLSLTFVLLVTFVGTLIHIYSVSYMEHDVARRRFFAYLNLFVAAMLLLVLGNSYLTLFFGWEGVGLASYLLISFWNYVPQYATAGKKAFVMNRVGDLGLLIAMMLMVSTFGSVSFTAVNTGAQASHQPLTLMGIFLLVAACGKSAQFPLQAWLGDAMAGPTPVSALIHAATMVTAGVYLMVRSGSIYATSTTAALAVAVIGLITLIFGAVVGAAKDDMKKVLAASTMSQIGYMMLAAGLGPVGATFAIFHLVTHGFFKANMFLGAGSVMHAMRDEVDMRGFGGLGKHMKITFATFVAGYLAIIGFPFLSGFYSKDKIIEAAFTGHGVTPWIFGFVTVLVAGLTAFYMSRLVFMIFLGAERWDKTGKNAKHPHDPSPLMWAPMAILAVGSVFLGAVLNYGGFLNWLTPVIGHAEHGEPVLPIPVISVMTLFIVAVGVLVAWKMYVMSAVPKIAPVGNVVVRAARKDLYQDQINETVFMKSGQHFVSGIAFTDHNGVDGIAEDIAKFLPQVGRLVGKLQSGHVRSYASYMVVGLVLALIVAVSSALIG